MSFKKSQSKKYQNNSQFQFVNFSLQSADEKAFKGWSSTLQESEFEDLLQQFGFDGYKVSFSVDHENECFTCTIIGTDSSPNPNKGLSSKAGTFYEALLLCTYKVREVFKGVEWFNPYSQSGKWG